ncbi:DUF3231 family protein [Methylobacter psychrophilus]|uniref:DUF3231 family protein n=1 Tax=Methylobacter psychrophilus TaxID=96941 RepID=UPI0021D4AACB|nr:DUF3231 family protein [Methylobacter psychrophilus]
MLNKNTDSFSLKILVIAVTLAFSASAVAGNDRGKNNGKNHIETHASNHAENHVNLTPGSKTKLKSYLTSGVEPLAQGEIKLEQKTSKTEFSAEVKIPVPSSILAVTDSTVANSATMFLVLRNNLGVDYAECHLDMKNIKTVTKRGISSVIAEYEVKISDRNGFLQASAGVCDVDLAKVGIQSGMPLIQYGDSAEVTIDTNNAIVGLGNF